MANNKNVLYDTFTNKRSLPYSDLKTGSITSDDLSVVGVNTLFTTEAPAGSWIVDLSVYEVRKVRSVISNTLLTLYDPFTTDIAPPAAQTSGTLIIGVRYTIGTFVAGDDFVNVGGTNVTGNIFTATGTTPTVWSNSSSLNAAGQQPNIIHNKNANPTEISVIIPLVNSSGVAYAFGTIDNKVFPSGLPLVLSKSNKSDAKNVTIDPIIVDATSTLAIVTMIY